MNELVKNVLEDLRGTLASHDVEVRELADWCGVSRSAVSQWCTYGPPEPRAYQIAYYLEMRRGVVTRSPAMDRLIEALRWYATGAHYTIADVRPGLRSPSSPSAITVYQRPVLNDRGAIARMVLREVGDE